MKDILTVRTLFHSKKCFFSTAYAISFFLLISHFEMICLLQIVETMSYTDNVATFLNSLDSFYENVPAEDLELLIGPIIDRVRSRPDSPLSGSPLGNYCLQMFTTHVLLSCRIYFKPVPKYVNL